jgi:hypothetical protein
MGNCVRTLSFDSDSSFDSELDLKTPIKEAVSEEYFHTPRMYKWPTVQKWASLEAAAKFLLNDFNNLDSEEVREACLYVKKKLISMKPDYFDNNTRLSPPHKKNKWANHWVLADDKKIQGVKFKGVYIVAAQIIDYTLVSQWLVYIDDNSIDLCEFKKVDSIVKKKNILQ